MFIQLSHFNNLLFVALGTFIGLLAWIFFDSAITMPLSLLIFPLWFYSPSRLVAYFVVLFYYLSSTIEVPFAGSNYIDFKESFFYWLVAQFISALPYLLFFKDKVKRAGGLLLAIILTAIPPFGIVATMHPISSLGIFWEGGGFFAITCFLIVVPLCVRIYPLFVIPFVVAVFSQPFASNPVPNWKSFNTELSRLDHLANSYERQVSLMNILNNTDNAKFEMLVLPETITGLWLSGNKNLWKTRYELDVPVLFGSIIKEGDQLTNIVMLLNNNDFEVVYKQRQGVPVAMFNPFGSSPYSINLFDLEQSSHLVNGKKVGFLICYENYLVFPILLTAFDRPDYFIGLSNLWVTANIKRSSLRRGQFNLLLSWSRLFDIPFLYSENV